MKFYNFILAIIIVVNCFFGMCHQPALAQSNMAVQAQDLQEVYKKASDFVKHENQEKQTNWKALEVNPKIFVPQCMVPLTAKWGDVFMEGSKSNRSVRRYPVFVTCRKYIGNKSWTVHVPTTRPDDVIIHK